MKLLTAIAGSLLLLPLAACNSSSGGAVSQISPGDRKGAVDLTGTDLDGKSIDTAAYRGKPVVLVVWGSWCGPCNAEAPDVVAVAKQFGDTAQFLGIDVRDNSVRTDGPSRRATTCRTPRSPRPR